MDGLIPGRCSYETIQQGNRMCGGGRFGVGAERLRLFGGEFIGSERFGRIGRRRFERERKRKRDGSLLRGSRVRERCVRGCDFCLVGVG